MTFLYAFSINNGTVRMVVGRTILTLSINVEDTGSLLWKYIEAPFITAVKSPREFSKVWDKGKTDR